jgi:hypothetical protein
MSAASRRTPRLEMRAVDAGGGLTLSVPRGFETAPAGAALRIYDPARERTRSPHQIYVSVVPVAPGVPNPRTKEIAGRTIHYDVVEEDGGSGGPTLRLVVWVESGGRVLLLESLVQPDLGGDRDFHAEWAIAPTLQWRPPAGSP